MFPLFSFIDVNTEKTCSYKQVHRNRALLCHCHLMLTCLWIYLPKKSHRFIINIIFSFVKSKELGVTWLGTGSLPPSPSLFPFWVVRTGRCIQGYCKRPADDSGVCGGAAFSQTELRNRWEVSILLMPSSFAEIVFLDIVLLFIVMDFENIFIKTLEL